MEETSIYWVSILYLGSHLGYLFIHFVVQQIFGERVFYAPGTVLAIVYRAVNKADIIIAALMELRLVEKAYTKDVHEQIHNVKFIKCREENEQDICENNCGQGFFLFL